MATFAARWATALHGAGAPERGVAATERQLAGLVERLAGALTADPFRPLAGREVGAELFGVDVPGEPLGPTVAVLAGLPAELGPDARQAAARMPELLGALVSGYTLALRACTLEDLEARATGESRAERVLAAQQALYDEQSRYRAVLAGVEVPVALFDPAGGFVDANSGFVDLLRHRPAYLRAHTLYDLVCPEDAPMLERVVDRDLVHGPHRRVRTEVRMRRRSGSTVAVPLALSVTREPTGEAAYLVVAATARRANGELVTEATPPAGIPLAPIPMWGPAGAKSDGLARPHGTRRAAGEIGT